MIPNEKFVEIAKGLLEKTRAEKASWKAHGRLFPAALRPVLDPSSGSQPTEFLLHLPSTQIRLELDALSPGPDKVLLKIMNKEGELVGLWTVTEQDEDWSLAMSLYQEVSKKVTKWDKALEEVEAFIGKP